MPSIAMFYFCTEFIGYRGHCKSAIRRETIDACVATGYPQRGPESQRPRATPVILARGIENKKKIIRKLSSKLL